MKATRNNLVVLAVVTVLSLALFASPSQAQEKRYLWTAQEVGTGLFAMTTNVTNIVSRYLPKDVKIDILPSGAVVASCTMVNDGKAQFGWAEASAAWAYNGIVLYNKKHENLRSIAGGLQFANMQAFALKKFSEAKNVRSFEDLKKNKVAVTIATKKRGTMGQAAGPMQLEAYGITYDDIKAWGGRIIETDVPEIVNLMKDGRADLWLDNLAPGHPAATELYQSVDLVILEHTPQGIAHLQKYGFFGAPVPANTWKGQTKEIVQPGATTLITTHKDVPADIVYLVTKAVMENAEEIRKSHAVMKHFDEKTAWTKERTIIPQHPGAEKYYREKGFIK
jgi:hypothetical protein